MLNTDNSEDQRNPADDLVQVLSSLQGDPQANNPSFGNFFNQSERVSTSFPYYGTQQSLLRQFHAPDTPSHLEPHLARSDSLFDFKSTQSHQAVNRFPQIKPPTYCQNNTSRQQERVVPKKWNINQTKEFSSSLSKASSPSERKMKKLQNEIKIYESEIESKDGNISKKRYSNRNASKRYRAKQKEIRETLIEQNRILKQENTALKRQLAMLTAHHQNDLSNQLEVLRQESFVKIKNALKRNATHVELQTLILQLQNNSDIDSDSRVSLFKDHVLNSINHILPAYAKFIIWALDNTVSFKREEEGKRKTEEEQFDFTRFDHIEDVNLYELDQLLDLHYVHYERCKILDSFREKLAGKKTTLQKAILKLQGNISDIVGIACSFKEEFEQMRSVLQSWQVARLVLDIERVKTHRSLRVESIFKMKIDSSTHSFLTPYSYHSDKLLRSRKKSGDEKQEGFYSDVSRRMFLEDY